jgi:hypothetical protein
MTGLIIMETMSIYFINFRNKEDQNFEDDENFNLDNIDTIETIDKKKENLKEEIKIETSKAKIDKEKQNIKTNINDRKSSMFIQNNKNNVQVNLSSPDLKAAKRKNQFLELSPIKKKQSMFVKKTEK